MTGGALATLLGEAAVASALLGLTIARKYLPSRPPPSP